MISLTALTGRFFFCRNGKTVFEVIEMSYVDPKLRGSFESLSIDLKNEILKRDVKLYTLNDLIKCLEDIVSGK